MQKIKNKLILACAVLMALLLAPEVVYAQQDVAPEGFEYVDSLIYIKVPSVDSTYVGVDMFDLNVNQSDAIADAMKRHVKANPERTINGYRVRIFFDNKQTARVESEKILKKFTAMFPDIMAYRTYANPYFKVTVGDCRTKSEAMSMLARIKRSFPSAFVVKESIAFPVVDKHHVYDIDTVQVLRPVK